MREVKEMKTYIVKATTSLEVIKLLERETEPKKIKALEYKYSLLRGQGK